jgi:[ribosomal protein S5]-alanine N-acetyltransferase
MNISNAFKQFPQLETENLILRETKLSDAPAIFEIFTNEDVLKYHDVEAATNIQQIEFLIKSRAERFKNKERIRWGIAKKENDVIIGSCGYSIKNAFRAEIGYELAKAHWQKGIMSEALKAAIAWGFHSLELNRIEAMVMLGNIASMQVLNKLGFSEEGVLKEYGFWKGQFHDLKIFSLLKKDYFRSLNPQS